jgi:hypothetical protein
MRKRMNPEIKAKWIAALRSGQYEQARGGLQRYLYRDTETGRIDCGFCCLGVLCDLASHQGVCFWYGHDAAVTRDGEVCTNADSLPKEVMEWAGLEESDPEVPFPVDDEGQVRSLAALNDTYKLNFHRIADIIEETL